MILQKALPVISNFFRRTFCAFSLITLSIALVGTFNNTDELYKFVSVKQLFSFFFFSLLFALSFAICDFVKSNAIIRRALQFVLSYASLCAVIFGGGTFKSYVDKNAVQNTPFSVLSISFAFVIIYVICACVVLVAKNVNRKLQNNDKEYDNMFKNN